MIRNKSAVLRRCTALQEAEPTTIRSLASAGSPRRLARRAPLWEAGEAAHPVVVRSGVLREAVADGSLSLGLWGRGALLGAERLFADANAASVEAYEECVVLEIPIEHFREKLASDPGLARGLAASEQARRLDLQVRLANGARLSALQRLAFTVLELGQRFGVRDSRGTIVNLRLPHRELAGLIGTSRETASFSVGELRSRGLIEIEGKRVVILDRRGLQTLARG